MLTTTKGNEILSQCCETSVIEDTKPSPKDHTDVEEIYTCTGCKEECDVYDDKPEYHTNDLPDEPTLPGEDDELNND
jgi:hypothetical protein